MFRLLKYVLAVSGLLIAAAGQAELFRVGPTDVANGYPGWYQDTNGMVLDLCLPQTLNQLDTCGIAPIPGDPLPTLPFTFPGNWQDEYFWYGADASLPLPGVRDAILVEAVEAAFAIGPPVAGDQITFSRIRIKFHAPTAGTYTVNYPYGQEVFPDVAAGDLVFFTSDIGIGAPGDFTGALKGAIGPYLTPVTNVGGIITPTPPLQVDGQTFLADGITETLVTGSPFNTNYFEICVSNANGTGLDGSIGTPACLSTDQFIVFGKFHDTPIASPLSVTRATYATHVGMTHAHIDVFAAAEAGPGELTPDLTVGVANAPSARMTGPRDPGGLYYSQSVIPLASVANTVTVINSADVPPSSVVANLVDAVSIGVADFDATLNQLSISAMSSDAVTPPILTAIGLPGSITGADELNAGTLVMTLPAGTVPPQQVTVISSKGGRATETVTMPAHGTPYPTGAPLAVDDFLVTVESSPAAVFNCLANDGLEAIPSTLTLFSMPMNGTVVNNFDGTVSYTPNAGFFGADSFQYTVSSIEGLSSNIATAHIDVQQINDTPIANDDISAAPGATTSVVVNVTANDTDADGFAPAPGGLDPATVTVVAVSGLGATSNGDGTVTFTKDVTCEAAATCGFTYTVSDLGGLTSNVANVSVTTAGNLAPIANADAASVLESRSVTINVAANDVDNDGTLNLDSVTITTPPSSGAVSNIINGSVTYTAPAGAGTATFGYTIADNLGLASSEATVTVTINGNPDQLGVQRAQCRAGKNEWRVDGTSSQFTPHSVTVYRSATVGGGPVIGVYAVDSFGTWRMSKNNTNAACASFISVESSLGGTLEGVPVSAN